MLAGDREAACLDFDAVGVKLRAFEREGRRCADARRATSGEDALDIGDVAAIAIALAQIERGVGREARSREGDADINAD